MTGERVVAAPRADPDAAGTADRFYAAFDAADVEAWLGLLADDVRLDADGATVHGRPAVRAWIEELLRTHPGVRCHDRRTVTAGDTAVSEFLLADARASDGVPPWRLEGTVCEVVRVDAGRITSVRRYHDRGPDAAALRQLADEQAALRRVAELVAREAPAPDVLRAVADEAAQLAEVRFSILMRYEPDGGTEIVALSGPPPTFSLRMRAPPGGTNVAHHVWRTGQPTRMDDLRRATGRWPETALASGYSASAAAPIQIRARLWGVILVVARDGPLPAGTEDHLLNFAELAGTAISSAEDRLELRTLAHEQGSLRRVAELVARGAALEEVFAAASREASSLFEGTAAALTRYADDGDAVVVASTNSRAPIGLRIPSTPDTGTGTVRRTGAPHRTEDFAGTSLADTAAELGIHGAVTVPVKVEGEVWGTLSTTAPGPPIPADAERRLVPFADLVAAAIAAAQYRSELLATRARVLTTADETQRRVQRDVHDGAQQRLVHTIINLKLARDASADQVSVTRFVEEALRSAERANRELRDVVRGILPAALTRGGLRPGIESLVADLPLPVDLRVDVPRLPAGVETTACFVVAEALTNVVKHSGAGQASVAVSRQDDQLVIDVRDDGAGGADARRGTGLTGLHDRVAANDGRLTISSRPGQGTHVQAFLPTS